MSNKLYITAIEDRSGKSLITLGIMEILLINIEKVAFFRPFIDVDPQENQTDNDLVLISETFGLDIPYEDMYAFTVAEASHLASEGRQAEVLEEILNKFTRLEETYDFVLCEGTDFRGSTASFELDINAQIANHLGCPVILVAKAKNKTIDEAITAIEISVDAILKKGNNIIATFINRVPAGEESAIVKTLKKRVFFKDQPVYAIPEVLFLNDPTMGEIIELLDARVLYGEDQTDLPVHRYVVAAMQLRNFLERLEYGSLVITPGDRADVIIATLSTVMSSTMPYISGIVLTGGLVPEESIHKLIKGFKRIVPILSVESDTFPAVRKIDTLNTVIMPGDSRKISLSLATFEEGVNMAELEDKIISSQTTIVTPIMFEYRLLQKARLFKQHIVLPEGDEPRILRATEILLHRSVVDITLLGDRDRIERNAAHLGLKIEGAAIIDPSCSDLLDDYIETYCELRKHKEITRDSARDIMMDVNFFGTMMVYKGHADGLVSGAVHTTADTIRPAFQFIKTRPGCSIVSSVMLMCLKDRVFVYGDCAVNPNPDSETLSEIAISSAATARLFKIEPRVAMLSYATGESGKGADVDTVREAVRLTKKKIAVSDPGLKIEGPIQYDAAVDSAVAKTKMPESEVAGKATVFIFPDLNTGNNTYKAVQRSAGAVAIGPVLQGLRKPVNDLSRGCLVNDIVNTVAITAVQAQEERLS